MTAISVPLQAQFVYVFYVAGLWIHEWIQFLFVYLGAIHTASVDRIF